MKIIFIGSVKIGHIILESIYESNYSVDTIFTLSFDKSEQTSGFFDYKPISEKYQSNLIRTNNINTEENISQIKKINPDIIIVAGWQRLICKEILEIPRLGTIGFHSSLLPKYRGRAPVNWAIIMGEKETGITMMYLSPGVDDGDIIAQKSFRIMFDDDCGTVYDKAATAGAELMKEYLPIFEKSNIPVIHNDSNSYPAYPKRTPVDGLIDFKRSALDVYNFVRALTRPYPGAYYYDNNGNKIYVWRIGIIFDDNQIRDNDIVLETNDLKVFLIDYSIEKEENKL